MSLYIKERNKQVRPEPGKKKRGHQFHTKPIYDPTVDYNTHSHGHVLTEGHNAFKALCRILSVPSQIKTRPLQYRSASKLGIRREIRPDPARTPTTKKWQRPNIDHEVKDFLSAPPHKPCNFLSFSIFSCR